jgi:outer membrane protein
MRFVLILALIWQQLALAQALPPTPTSRQTPGSPGSRQDPLAQQPPGAPIPSGTTAAAGTPAPSSVLQNVESNNAEPKDQKANSVPRVSVLDFLAPYRRPTAPPLKLNPADRARSLIRNGVVYLSLYDAIALAIENNLDVEVARYNLSISGTERLRASGGGDLRGIDYTVAESPTGVGGPGSSLLNSAASSVTPTTPTINDLTSINELTEMQTDLSLQSPAGFAAGPTIPTYQPTFIGQNTWFQRSNSTLLTTTSGTSTLPEPETLNCVAQADAARHLLQVRQAEAKTQLLANQVREQAENSVIALQTARSALAATIQSRKYQEQLVDAEKDMPLEPRPIF